MRKFSITSTAFLFVLTACGTNRSSPNTDGGSVADVGAGVDTGTSESDAASGISDGGTDSSEDAGVVPANACTAAQGTVYNVYKNAFFGVLHEHTSYSMDAYEWATRVTPAEAYQFAKGGPAIKVADGLGPSVGPLPRPLDFLAITDHSEWLGLYHEVTGCLADASIPDNPDGAAPDVDQDAEACTRFGNPTQQAWADEIQAATDAYEPCKFTSLVAYEWTSVPTINGEKSTNHRNVIFQNATVPLAPLDSNDYPTSDDLFQGLDTQCTGDCAAIVIPHNTNMSYGNSLGISGDLTATQVADRQKYQRLVEIYQHKGASECLYGSDAGSGDPECAFEYLSATLGNSAANVPSAFVRESLGNGLLYAAQNGTANPLQLGIIAAMDDHNATPGLVQEDTYVGHLGYTDDTAAVRLSAMSDWSPGGLAGVWAEENTRESIYAALERRETYGTSGPRMLVRFYETTNANPCTTDFPKTIVDGGAIPMGGSFGPTNVAGSAPTFAIAAWPDTAPQPTIDNVPGGRPAQLASAAVIKVHIVSTNGTLSMVEDPPYQVTIDPQGSCTAWTDPNYQASESAVYYVRVLQEPTHRWSYYDCQTDPKANASGCADGGALMQPIRERAWTSPIWFNP